MTIRTRLIMVSLLVAIPTAGGFAGYLTAERWKAGSSGLVQWTEAQLHNLVFRVNCMRRGHTPAETSPHYILVQPTDDPVPPDSSPSGAGRADETSFRLFAFDETLQKPFPASAVVPAVVFEGLAADAGRALAGEDQGPMARLYSLHQGLWYVKATGLGGNCAFAVATMERPLPTLWEGTALATMIGAVFLAALVSGGTVVRRVRRLTRHVRQSAEEGYEPVPVEGRDELATLASAFNDAGAGLRRQLDEVGRREQTLREFVANTGHDIATPLSVLQGHLSALERETTLTDAARADVAAAIGEADHLRSILGNLAATAKLETPGWIVDVRATDLVPLVERLVDRHQPAARAAGVELNLAVPRDPVVAEVDATLFEQAVGNLVDNAIRYNRRGGHVAVLLDATGAADGRFAVSVTDDGPGVSDASLAHLGERHFRADEARSRRPEGQGIGLAIAREVADRLDCTLS
ncbi:MAG: HAMP domain-containing sensor histidine kinase, partial [Vicinamibacterales bacterium]